MNIEMLAGLVVLGIGIMLFYISSNFEDLKTSSLAAVIGIALICVGSIMLLPYAFGGG